MGIQQQVVLLVGILISLYAVTQPQRFLIIVGLILITPHLVILKLLLIAFQTISVHTVCEDGELRVTLWHRVQLRINLWFWKTFSKAANLFNNFVRKEMIEVSSGVKDVEYVPVDQRDKPANERSTFTLRKLSKERQAEIKDRMLSLGKTGRIDGLRNRSVRLAITREMLDGWTNVGRRDEATGKIVPIKFDKTKRDTMYEILPDTLTDELEARFGDGSLDWEQAEKELAEQERQAEAFKAELELEDAEANAEVSEEADEDIAA